MHIYNKMKKVFFFIYTAHLHMYLRVRFVFVEIIAVIFKQLSWQQRGMMHIDRNPLQGDGEAENKRRAGNHVGWVWARSFF